jgi:CRISPR/Cas system-associated exonuclease Cas4 (RecB family)
LIEVELPDNGSISIQSLKAFEEVLINILEDLFNEKIPFSQTSDRNICKYCPFIGICFR